MVQFIVDNFTIICTVLSAVITLISLLIGNKSKKGQKALNSLAGVIERLPTYIKTAEKLGGSGEDKKAYVLEQVRLYLRADGVSPTAEQLDTIGRQIDEQVKLTKSLHVAVRRATEDTSGVGT